MRLLPCALLLVGCGDPTLYPRYPAVLQTVDTGLGSLTEAPLICGRFDEGTVAQLDVVNQGTDALDLYTVDPSCVMNRQGTVAAGEVYSTTVGNHLAWAAVDPVTGRRVATFALPSGSGVQWVEYVP
jgi:hypothetical protein